MFKLATTLKTFNGNIVAKPDDVAKLYCVYEHWINTPNGMMLIFVGCCRLNKVFEMTDARRNTAWLEMFKSDITIEIRIIATSLNQVDCKVLQMDTINAQQPYCNKNGHLIGGGKAAVTCVTTGRHWSTATQCATEEGISLSQLSAHLNGRVGFATVKGRIYRRGI